MFTTPRSFRYALPVLLFTSLAACGGGGSDTGDPPPLQKATVTIVFTDAPSDDFDQINLTVRSIELLGDDGPVVLFEGTEVIDLLMLENFSDLFVVADEVPAGTYSKIRLRIDDLELVRLDDDGAVLDTVHPDLPANGKIDLNPRSDFVIAPGDSLVVELDVDARKSIHIVTTGNGGYRFRPVVFVERLGDRPSEKLIRAHGVVTEIRDDGTGFVLCQDRPVSSASDLRGDREHCVTVLLSDTTGIFDSSGAATDIGSIAVGDEVTVVGEFVMDENDDLDDATTLQAHVIEIGPPGTFDRLDGSVVSAPNAEGVFEFMIAPGQGFAPDSVVATAIQLGTGIFSDEGVRVGADAVQPGVDATVDGVLTLSDAAPDLLRAALVVLEIDADDGTPDDDAPDMISGEVMTVDAANDSLVLATDDGDRCVVVAEGADIFRITDSDDGSLTERIDLTDLAGATADLYGREGEDGCFVAVTIIAAAGD